MIFVPLPAWKTPGKSSHMLSKSRSCEATPQVVQRPFEAVLIAQEPEQIDNEAFLGFRLGFESLHLPEECTVRI